MTSASLVKRMAAWVYEGLLLFAVCALTGLAFSIATNSTNALTHHIALGIVLFVVMGIYFSWFWSKGQTLAMKTWRIKITNMAGEPISIRLAAMRYVLSWLWFAPPLLALVFIPLTKQSLSAALVGWVVLYVLLAWIHPSKQFLHDRLAGTRLINVLAKVG
jgi:uncharacterized RDD family membrane protein YckC